MITVPNFWLTLSLPVPLRLNTLPYWSNPPFLISDMRALRTERQSARMSEINNGGLDQYGTEPFEQQQFGTAGVEGVNYQVLRILAAYKLVKQKLPPSLVQLEPAEGRPTV